MKAEQKPLTQESYLNNEFMENEVYSQLKVPKTIPFAVRLDGWKFRSLCEKLGAEKPFDLRIAKCLVDSCMQVLRNFNPSLVYVISDEINFLFIKNYPFDGRIEKINSVLSGLTSATFSLNVEKHFGKTTAVSFDSRIVILSDKTLMGYLIWRQQNGWRNHNNAYAYWLLRKLGYSSREASRKLKGLKTKQIHEFLFKHGINLAETPAWQRRGIIIYREVYEKEVKGIKVKRRRTVENWNPPPFTSKEGQELIYKIIKGAVEKNK